VRRQPDADLRQAARRRRKALLDRWAGHQVPGQCLEQPTLRLSPDGVVRLRDAALALGMGHLVGHLGLAVAQNTPPTQAETQPALCCSTMMMSVPCS
jgi:hypothetical protein